MPDHHTPKPAKRVTTKQKKPIKGKRRSYLVFACSFPRVLLEPKIPHMHRSHGDSTIQQYPLLPQIVSCCGCCCFCRRLTGWMCMATRRHDATTVPSRPVNCLPAITPLCDAWQLPSGDPAGKKGNTRSLFAADVGHWALHVAVVCQGASAPHQEPLWDGGVCASSNRRTHVVRRLRECPTIHSLRLIQKGHCLCTDPNSLPFIMHPASPVQLLRRNPEFKEPEASTEHTSPKKKHLRIRVHLT